MTDMRHAGSAVKVPHPLLVIDILTRATNCVLHLPPSLLCTWLSSLFLGDALLWHFFAGVHINSGGQLEDCIYISLVLCSIATLDQLCPPSLPHETCSHCSPSLPPSSPRPHRFT